MQYELAKNFITSDEQGGALEATTYGTSSVLALIGCLHVAISIYLCYAFLRPLWRADRQLGGGDPALRAQTRRVLIATVVAVAGRVAQPRVDGAGRPKFEFRAGRLDAGVLP